MNITDFFSNSLNPSQFAAVEKTDGPLLILAGAGSGKTRVLTYRLANIVAKGLATPEEILAVTFTNKAAGEMVHRAEKILNDIGITIRERLWVSTFHATCVRILRDHIQLLGYKRNFTIYDSSDQIALIKKVAAGLNLKEKEHPAKNFAYRIRAAKMDGKRPEDIQNNKDYYMDKRTLEVYKIYEQEMFRANALDFDDLLMKTLLLLENFPKVLQAYQRRFRYIMVDEYQDTNFIQYRIVKLLAMAHSNLCVVGDEDQSIYSWRGADISNILNFESDFENAFVVKLEENYRSTQTIVNAASEVIANNTQRKGKTLFSNQEEGDPIIIREEDDDRDEAKFIVKQIKKIVGVDSYKDIAIFYRNNAQSRVIEEHLRAENIPYKIIGGLRFYDRLEIKDMLAYLRLLNNPNDDVALKRVINVPARGIGKTSVSKIEDLSNDRSISMLEGLHIACTEKLVNAGTIKKFTNFLSLIANMQAELESLAPSEVLNMVMQDTGYLDKLQKDDTPEAIARLDNLEELSNALVQFETERKDEATLDKFLEEMALASDQDQVKEDIDCVYLMTLHVSKGLEYPHVFIVGMEENIFPSAQSVESNEAEEIEEERRLAYVGYTRAMRQLYLTHARRRRMWGQTQFNAPSRFLDEIPSKFVTTKVRTKPKLNAIGGSSFRSAMNQSSDSFDSSNPWGDDSFDQSTPSFDEFSQDNSWGSSTSAANDEDYQKGMRVRHSQFGSGTIYDVKGSGDKAKLTVIFDGNFLKNFVAKYAKLERI